MARANSIILTKEDKKAKLAELNDGIKELKTLTKGVGIAVKENDATLKAALKEHAGVAKALEKEVSGYAKQLALLEAQKSALMNEPVPAPKPTSVLDGAVKRTRRTKAEMEAARAAA